jgi:hypothetical protein
VSEVIKAAFAYLDHEHPTVRAALEEIRQLQELARRTVSGQEAGKAFTAVFLNVTRDEAEEIVSHPKWSAGSWSHALDERDAARAAIAAPIPATEQKDAE